LLHRRRNCAEIGGDSWVFCAQRVEIARVSSAVSSPVMGVTWGAFCDWAATEGIKAAAPTAAVACRTRRRPGLGE
jgi:hypothetical protein